MENTEGNVVWTGGANVPPRRKRRWLIAGAASGLGAAVISAAMGLWLVAAPIQNQTNAWYWFQAKLFHSDAGDRFLAAIEQHDRLLFESSVSRSCGDNHDELCFLWRYDDADFHRHWGHIITKNREGERVSIWNVNRKLDGYLGPEETVQAWGFVLDKYGLVKAVL